MKKSYLIACLLVIVLGPLGLFYTGGGTAFILLAALVGSVVFKEDMFRFIDEKIVGTPFGDHLQESIDLVSTWISKSTSIDTQNQQMVAFYILLVLVAYIVSCLLTPFYVSRYNRSREEERYNSLYSRMAEVERNLTPKIPEKLQAPCLKCGKIISVKNKDCPRCATTKPFDDKKKVLEYIENNLKEVYLSEGELRKLSYTVYGFSAVVIVLHNFFDWFSGITEKEKRAEMRATLNEFFKAIKEGYKVNKGNVNKFFLYVFGGILAISGASYFISLLFDTSPFILWVILSVIFFLLFTIGSGYYAVTSYKLYKDIFATRKKILYENYMKNTIGHHVGDEVKKRLMRFTNIFREKYRDSDELEALKVKYFTLGEKIEELYKEKKIKEALNLKSLLLIPVFLFFTGIAIEYFSMGFKYFPAGVLFAWIAFLVARTIWSLYYIGTTYLWDIKYKLNCGFCPFGSKSLKDVLNYKEEL